MGPTRLVAVAAAAAVVLAGCSSADSSGQPQEPKTLRDLTGDELCAGLPEPLVERVVGVNVSSAAGARSESSVGPDAWVVCGYAFDDDVADAGGAAMGLDTQVSPAEEDDDVAALQRRFTDPGGTLHAFENVAGLGAAAGYGKDPLPSSGNTPILVVVFQAGQQRYLCELSLFSNGSLDQLKQLAGELLKAVKAELE